MIVSYGLKFVLPFLVAAVLLFVLAVVFNIELLFYIAIICIIAAGFLAYFYRNPYRELNYEDDTIVAPADGTVLSIEDIDNKYIGGNGKKISIFLSLFNVHINRVPASGKIDYVDYSPGVYHPGYKNKASFENERTEIGLARGHDRIIFKQIAGLVARRIECDLEKGQVVLGGQIFGMIHFGSRAELFVPKGYNINVKKGDKIKAGLSVVARTP